MSSNKSWDIGDIKMHHSYNSTVPVGRGWMRCDGLIVNSTNYDALFGTGAYASDGVASSPIAGKYLPNFASAASSPAMPIAAPSNITTETGVGPIAIGGNLGMSIDLQHTHGTDHNHKVLDHTNTTTVQKIYDTDDTPIDVTAATLAGTVYGVAVTNTSGQKVIGTDWYTEDMNGSSLTDIGGSSAMNIQPRSVAVEFYMKVI